MHVSVVCAHCLGLCVCFKCVFGLTSSSLRCLVAPESSSIVLRGSAHGCSVLILRKALFEQVN